MQSDITAKTRPAWRLAMFYFAAVGVSTCAFHLAISVPLDLQGPERLFSVALSSWLGGMMWHGAFPNGTVNAIVLRSTGVGVIAMIGLGLLTGGDDPAALLGLAAVIALIHAVLDTAVCMAGGGHVRSVVLGLFCTYLAAPLWLGPFLSDQPQLLGLVIWTNPLVHLSVQAGIDLFRSDALYAVSEVGGLRYSYPPRQLVLPAIFGVVLILLAALRYKQRAVAVH